MFKKIRQGWRDSALESAIEGVIREAHKGNALEVQRWFNALKKDCESQSTAAGVPPEELEAKALERVGELNAASYREIVERLTRPGELLEEVVTWRRAPCVSIDVASILLPS